MPWTYRTTASRPLATELDYDFLVLDLNLPRLDGVNILRVRVEKTQLPIVVLTARGRVDDRVMCLDAGADDYVVKPFSFSELSARIRALLRRSRLPSESLLVVEDLKLDRVERRVTRGSRMIELTSKEFALLEYLMRNAGRRVTRAMIIEHVWNLSFDTATNLVDVYVAYVGRLGVDEVQIVRCGTYAWVRLVVADTNCDLLFYIDHMASEGGSPPWTNLVVG